MRSSGGEGEKGKKQKKKKGGKGKKERKSTNDESGFSGDRARCASTVTPRTVVAQHAQREGGGGGKKEERKEKGARSISTQRPGVTRPIRLSIAAANSSLQLYQRGEKGKGKGKGKGKKRGKKSMANRPCRLQPHCLIVEGRRGKKARERDRDRIWAGSLEIQTTSLIQSVKKGGKKREEERKEVNCCEPAVITGGPPPRFFFPVEARQTSSPTPKEKRKRRGEGEREGKGRGKKREGEGREAASSIERTRTRLSLFHLPNHSCEEEKGGKKRRGHNRYIDLLLASYPQRSKKRGEGEGRDKGGKG